MGKLFGCWTSHRNQVTFPLAVAGLLQPCSAAAAPYSIALLLLLHSGDWMLCGFFDSDKIKRGKSYLEGPTWSRCQHWHVCAAYSYTGHGRLVPTTANRQPYRFPPSPNLSNMVSKSVAYPETLTTALRTVDRCLKGISSDLATNIYLKKIFKKTKILIWWSCRFDMLTQYYHVMDSVDRR